MKLREFLNQIGFYSMEQNTLEMELLVADPMIPDVPTYQITHAEVTEKGILLFLPLDNEYPEDED